MENQLCLIIGIQFVVFSHPRLGLSRTGHALPWKNLQGPRRDRWVSQDGAPVGKVQPESPIFHGKNSMVSDFPLNQSISG